MNSNKYRNCEFCAYIWITKVSSPKSCPRCKRRFDYKDAREVLEMLGKEFDYDLLGDLK